MANLGLAVITIERYLADDGSEQVSVEALDNGGELPSLTEMLGMLELAKNTVFRMAAGEFDEEPEEDEDADSDEEAEA